MEKEEKEEEAFKVSDKRRFREGAEEVQEETKEETKGKKGEPSSEQFQPPQIEINFASFIFSLGRSAFIHLGEEPDPVSGEKSVSLPMAKETIDVVGLLEEKTKGNLTPEEEQLIKNILYALRMKYVEMAAKRSGEEG